MSRAVAMLLVLLACAACAHAPLQVGRYLYEVTCEAEVIRFDTVAKKKTSEYDLAKRARGLMPISVGVLEVCLAKDSVFDPVASVFYTLVPTRLEPSDTQTFSYRLLSFSVPEIELVGQAPAGAGLEYAPRLELAARRVRVISPDEPLATYVDLSRFAPDRRDLPNRIVEWSGERLLVMLRGKDTDVFAVADRSSWTLLRLQLPPGANFAHVHLSPGGTHVLYDEASGPGPYAPTTGRLAIYDTRTGGVVKELFEPRIVGLHYHGMAPTGVALYQDSVRDELVDLGMTFPAEAVVAPTGAEYPGPAVFFADR